MCVAQWRNDSGSLSYGLRELLWFLLLVDKTKERGLKIRTWCLWTDAVSFFFSSLIIFINESQKFWVWIIVLLLFLFIKVLTGILFVFAIGTMLKDILFFCLFLDLFDKLSQWTWKRVDGGNGWMRTDFAYSIPTSNSSLSRLYPQMGCRFISSFHDEHAYKIYKKYNFS